MASCFCACAVSWSAAYHGLVRAIVRVTVDAATPLSHRRRMLEIDVDSGSAGSTVVVEENGGVQNIVVQASVEGSDIPPAQITIPVSVSLSRDGPLAVASK